MSDKPNNSQYRLVEVQIKNLKRLELFEVELDEDDNFVVVSGDNAAGKSSILDSIMWILKGSGIEVPLRKGASQGEGILTLTNGQRLTIRRGVTKKGEGAVTITTEDGSKVPSPQTFLNGLVGSLAFDPLEFVGMRPDKQAEVIRTLCGLKFDDLKEEHTQRYNRRTELNRELEEAETLLSNREKPDADLVLEERSAAELMAELQRLQKLDREAEMATEAVTRAMDDVAKANKAVRDAEDVLAAARKALEESQSVVTAKSELANAANSAAPAAEVLGAAHEAVATVDKHNAAVRNAIAYNEEKAKVTKLKGMVDAINVRLGQLKEEKENRIKSAQMPVPGMAVDEDNVIRIDGETFGQLSYAERVRVSAMVAMALNPKLPLVLIREGANLNKANTAMIANMAKERGAMVLFEKFSEEVDSDGLHMVDGVLAYVHGEPVAPTSAQLEPLKPAETPADDPPAVSRGDLFGA